MPPKNYVDRDLYIKVLGGYKKINHLTDADINYFTATKQDKLNRIRIESLRNALPENVCLVMTKISAIEF